MSAALCTPLVNIFLAGQGGAFVQSCVLLDLLCVALFEAHDPSRAHYWLIGGDCRSCVHKSAMCASAFLIRYYDWTLSGLRDICLRIWQLSPRIVPPGLLQAILKRRLPLTVIQQNGPMLDQEGILISYTSSIDPYKLF